MIRNPYDPDFDRKDDKDPEHISDEELILAALEKVNDYSVGSPEDLVDVIGRNFNIDEKSAEHLLIYLAQIDAITELPDGDFVPRDFQM